jgi:hypothetical protein
MYVQIDKEPLSLEAIQRLLRENPLVPLRLMLTDEQIYAACRKAKHEFRERTWSPVVTVFHYLLQAIQREESFAATCPPLIAPLIAVSNLDAAHFTSSATSQARSRLPKAVLEDLVAQACQIETEPAFEHWRGMRLLALDCSTLSMPAEPALFEYFGRPRARHTTMRFPLATMATLLAVGSSLIVGHNIGPYDRGEHKTAAPLLKLLSGRDLLLADRHFAGSPNLHRVRAQGAHFLMRKNARLIAERLPVLHYLGRNDFITEIPMSKEAREKDPSLPANVRVRIFKARWRAPSGERVAEWFVTSLDDAKKFPPVKLANLYHRRWQIETSYREFKGAFHADVLRSKTVDNVQKELLAHVLAYQLVRRLMLKAAKKHHLKPVQLSFLNAARWVLVFSTIMNQAPTTALPRLYECMLDAIAFSAIDIRPGRLEPRALARECKHYLYLRIPRSEWLARRLAGLPERLR